MAAVGGERLSLRGLYKSFGATAAVDGVELAIRSGEVRALIGENGAGKSTLMHLVSGALRPDRGEMRLDGETFRPGNPLEARLAGVVMIHQELALASQLTVAENLFLGIELTGAGPLGLLRRAEMKRRAAAALAELEHDDIPPDVPVARLSIAAQQIVEIARALILEARVLVFDEPTSSLSRPDVEKLFRLISRLKERGLSIVYISHFLEEVEEVADSFTVMRDGRVVGEGGMDGTSMGDIVRMMVGRDVSDLFPRSSRSPGEVVLELEGLAGERLPQAATLALRRGEVLGIAGLMGAGRTELMRAVFGLDRIRDGTIRLGLVTGWAPARRRLRQGAGLLSEDRQGEGLAAGRTIADNLTLSRLEGLGPYGLVFPGQVQAASVRWIEELSIQCRDALQKVGELSGGNQQKVAIGRLLYHDLDVLLLDEPTRGVDIKSKAQIYRLIDRLAVEERKAVLLVSSYLPELLGMADRIAVMSRGRLGPARPVAELTEESIMLECTGQTAAEREPA